MQKNRTRFALKLSREKIQLLLNDDKGVPKEIGSTDPNGENLVESLRRLLCQLNALTDNSPLVDVMLPNELILVQNLTVDRPLTVQSANKLMAQKCKVETYDINVSVGSPINDRTQRVAAVTTKTLSETRTFLTNAGFLINRFMGAAYLKGFNEIPIFTVENIRKRRVVSLSQSLNLYGAVALLLLTFTTIVISYSDWLEKSSSIETSVSTIDTPNLQIQSEYMLTRDKQAKMQSTNDFNPKIPAFRELALNSQNYRNQLEKNLTAIIDMDPIIEPTIEELDFNATLESEPREFDINPLVEVSSLNGISQSSTEVMKRLNIMLSSRNNEARGFNLSPNVNIFKLKSSINILSLEKDQIGLGVKNKKAKIPQLDLLDTPKDISYGTRPLQRTESAANSRSLHSKNFFGWRQKYRTNSFEGDKIPKLNTFLPNLSQQTALYPPIFTNLDSKKMLLKSKKPGPFSQTDDYIFTKEKLLVSKEYRPIKRPLLISKINILSEPTLSSGAVTLSLAPLFRPESVGELVQLDPKDLKIKARATRRPSFPTRASVSNNATISNIFELNRTNLIGIFGTESNAVALIRLASGRIIRVKVGDKFDGWRVLSILKDKIELANGRKQETLRLPG